MNFQSTTGFSTHFLKPQNEGNIVSSTKRELMSYYRFVVEILLIDYGVTTSGEEWVMLFCKVMLIHEHLFTNSAPLNLQSFWLHFIINRYKEDLSLGFFWMFYFMPSQSKYPWSSKFWSPAASLSTVEQLLRPASCFRLQQGSVKFVLYF